MKKFNVAIAGATGAVGEVLIDLLETRDFPIDTLHLLASTRSAGTSLNFAGKRITVSAIDDFDFSQAHICLLYTSPSPRDS